MADVRSMLRAERASRRITHPNASYTSDGRLLCNLCEMMIKSEAAWQGHLHSTGHTLRLDRAREAAAARNVESAGKKRKAETLDSPSPDDKKRARSAGEEAPNADRQSAEERKDGDGGIAAPATAHVDEARPTEVPSNGGAPPATDDAVDEAELAAFERELAAMEQPSDAAAAIQADATISAAPLTAEELAAQAREEQSAQRGRRDAELEDEREDAALALQEEFEEMDSLEQRLRKLREKREALRKGSTESGKRAEVDGALKDGPKAGGGGSETVAEGGGNGNDDGTDDDDDDDEEDFDDWNFGAR
ncbi:hypothetical protein D0869_05739 [Hortaea werneckii]|uniref:Uncharacterized protein n=1 Tax=Hortaea werneckii TaxID=91943 RepID=A0A3M6YH49_HORWE|nr:hypothetical protein KC334_g4718 [Hortaea werneckii]KAI7014491.1 hypothetical protein KC355_g4666 [Hortaea werneckii]KAI7199605.1 hypothetical protein KC324_g3175 [Hortaea werneckii]KAI7588578.1 hypothetical protein KC316_g4407 [Hortaea werneckii]KAI7657673.1 hypothetical protein KC318_g11678 [Hortaea werneckii]